MGLLDDPTKKTRQWDPVVLEWGLVVTFVVGLTVTLFAEWWLTGTVVLGLPSL